MRWLLAFVIVAAALPAAAADTWLDAKVVNAGHIQDGFSEVQVVTIVLLDTGNIDSHERVQVWAVLKQAFLRRTHADLRVGAEFKARMEGERFMQIRYVDQKGREKSETHSVVRALGVEDIPQ
jgi:hypothetical protein